MKYSDYIKEGNTDIKPASTVKTDCPCLEVNISSDYGHRLVCRLDKNTTTTRFYCDTCVKGNVDRRIKDPDLHTIIGDKILKGTSDMSGLIKK